MFHPTQIDPLEDAIDQFEENWSPDSFANIQSLLDQHDLQGRALAITEFVRVDIELKTKRGLTVDLDNYFCTFAELLEHSECVSQIAFEDYRARSVAGQPLHVSRWQNLPGVSDAPWFQSLVELSSSLLSCQGIQKHSITNSEIVESKLANTLHRIGFEIIDEIGQGSFGSVYLAIQAELANRYVVLKVIDTAIAESQYMATLQHTNIVPIHSIHSIGSQSVICMPYAGRVTLAEFLKEINCGLDRCGETLAATVRKRVQVSTIRATDCESLSDQRTPLLVPAADDGAVLKPLNDLVQLGCGDLATWIFSRIASALAHSHARGILHGDLKPGNVLIRNDGEPALLDFNLAQTIGHRKPKYVGGTLPYMPPESLSDLMKTGSDLAPRHPSADLYSLGVMLYEFVTGRLPYPSPNSVAPIDLAPAYAARKSSLDWHIADEVSPSMRSIIGKLLEFSPQDRYETAEQVHEDLVREHRGESLITAREPMTHRMRKWFRRNPHWTSGAAISLSLGTLLLGTAWFAYTTHARSDQLTAAAKFNAFSAKSSLALASAMADPLRSAEDGIAAAMQPLEEFGVLEPNVVDVFGLDRPGVDDPDSRREALLRHIVQTGVAESVQLRSTFRKSALDKTQLARLDQLIEAAARIRGPKTSRACKFLEAERARLSGQKEEFNTLFRTALRLDFDSDTELYLEAVRLVSIRRWQDSVELLTKLSDRASIPSALRWTMLGRSQYNLGQYENAKISFTQSIEHAQTSSRLRLLRGLCYFRLGQGDLAEQDFTRAFEFEPTLTSALTNRALIRLAQGRTDEGLADLSLGLKHSPDNVEVLLLRSRAYRNQGLNDEADRDFALAIAQKDGLTASACIARASARRDLDPNAALEDLRRADELNPGSSVIQVKIASLLAIKLDRREEAIDILGQVTQNEPHYERAFIDRAVWLAQLERFEEAILDLNKAIETPNSPRTLYQAACVCALMPDEFNHRRAVGFLAQALRAGYEPDQLATDPDLKKIRSLPGFLAVQRTFMLGPKTSQEISPLSPVDNQIE